MGRGFLEFYPSTPYAAPPPPLLASPAFAAPPPPRAIMPPVEEGGNVAKTKNSAGRNRGDLANPEGRLPVAGGTIEAAGLATSPNARDNIWIPCVSSNVCKIKYSPAEARGRLRKGEQRQSFLYVQFWRTESGFKMPGPTYRYDGVPRAVWDGLLAASSKGVFMHQNVKGVFPFTGPL